MYIYSVYIKYATQSLSTNSANLDYEILYV